MNNQIRQTGRASKPIERRDRHFDLSTVDLRRRHGGSVPISQRYNAMSQFFPESEKCFVDAARHYRDRIDGDDPALLDAIRGFIGQEAMHGREHRPTPITPEHRTAILADAVLGADGLEQDQAMSSVAQAA